MLIVFFSGNTDAPLSDFLGNNSPNNFYAIRPRTGAFGFRFFAHDSEHTLLDVNENRLGPYRRLPPWKAVEAPGSNNRKTCSEFPVR